MTHFQRALTALQTGKSEKQRACSKRRCASQPRHVATLNLLGIVLTKLSKFAEAENYLRRALGENANSDTTLYNYGIVLKALNRPDEALRALRRSLDDQRIGCGNVEQSGHCFQ